MRYGEVWEYEGGTRWMVVAPDLQRRYVDGYLVVYMGSPTSDAGSSWLYVVERMRVGRGALDSMSFEAKEKWRRVA